MKKVLLHGTAMLSVLFLAGTAAAHAQAATGDEGKQAVEPAKDASNDDIVVTGSRVVSNGNQSPTPLTVVSTQQLTLTTPSNIPDGLNKLPVFAGSRGQTTTGSMDNNSSGNFLNLRNVGAARTLILFDGHRLPPSSGEGIVDTNVIPQMLLQRVDVVTGGVSAVYGSDAITGVVNFVVDRKYNGLKAQAQAGLSQRGDAPSQRLGIAGGQDVLGGRGHVLASFEYFNSGGISSNSARKTSSRIYTVTGAGTDASPFVLNADSRSQWISFNGHPLFSALSAYQFGTGSTLIPFVQGTATADPFTQIGGSGGYVEPTGLTGSLRSYQGFARFDYDLSDKTRFYAQASMTQSRNQFTLTPFLYIFKYIDAGNAFLPDAARTILSDAGEAGFLFGKAAKDVSPLSIDTRTRNIFGNIGFAGEIGDGWKFDASYTHGETRLRFITHNNTDNARLAAALDAVRAPDGSIVCNVTLTNPGLYPGCVPINPFGPGSERQAALDYVRRDTEYVLTNKLDDFSGSIVGSPFSTWAGPVTVALSAEYRRQTLRNDSSNQPGTIDCTGLRFNCVPDETTVTVANVAADARGSQTVKEAALEADIPLLQDSVIARSINLNAAVRFADYRTSGGNWTWKAGLDWHVNDLLRLRATRSRDVRAPTLYDLFQPARLSRLGYFDLLTNVNSVLNTQSQGNPDLKPERSDTLTAGVVITPAPRLSFALDYYRIRIRDAIVSLSGADTSVQRQCNSSGGTSPLCALYVRPLGPTDTSAANYPTLLLSQNLNAAEIRTEGVDAEANWSMPLGAGMLALRAMVSYQPKLSTRQTPADIAINAAGAAGLSKWRVTGFVNYSNGPIGVNILERWRSSQRQSGDPRLVFDIADVPAAAFTDLTVTLDTKGSLGGMQFFASIQNLFDKTAPIYVGSGSAAAPGYAYPAVPGDDVLGRYFTFGAKVSF